MLRWFTCFNVALILSLSGPVVLTSVIASAADCRGTESRFPVQVAEAQFVEATLRLPGCLEAGQKVPVFLIFGGFESAGKVLDLIHPTEPLALASFDYPFTASRKLEFRDGFRILREGKVLYPETVRGIINFVSALRRMPQIDPGRVTAIGASFGAPFVLGAAARDSDISGVALVHGFGRVPETAEHVILRSWLPKYGWRARPLAWLVSRLGWLLLDSEMPESEAAKLSSKQRVLMITAKDDSFIPRESSDSLWAALEKSQSLKSRVIMPGDHLMPGSDRLIEQIMHKIEAWEARKSESMN